MKTQVNAKIKVFVTYSLTPIGNQARVRDFVSELKRNNFDAKHDQILLEECNGDLQKMMVEGLRHDKIVVVLNEEYKRKADDIYSTSGVYTEWRQIADELQKDSGKFVFVSLDALDEDKRIAITPRLLANIKILDLTSDVIDDGYNQLIARLRNESIFDFSQITPQEVPVKKYIGKTAATHILSDEQIMATTEEDYHYFTKVILPTEPSKTADRFYKGFAAEIEDIAANFDFLRDNYISGNGIKPYIQRTLTEDGGINFIKISGVAGTGKTTMLTRIAYDLTSQGVPCFRLNEEINEQQIIIFNEIIDIINNNKRPVIIIDNAMEFIDYLKLNSVIKINKMALIILCDRPNAFKSVENKLGALRSTDSIAEFKLEQLSRDECVQLIDKMESLEVEGLLSRNESAIVDREQRLKICNNRSRGHFVVAMLQIRYARPFREIIRREYEAIPGDIAKEAYLMLCYFNAIQIALPKELVFKITKTDTILSIQALEDALSDIVNWGKTLLRVRHTVIAEEIKRNYLSDKSDICENIIRRVIDAAITEFDNENYELFLKYLRLDQLKKTLRTDFGDYTNCKRIAEFLLAAANKTGYNNIVFSAMKLNAQLMEYFNIDDWRSSILNIYEQMLADERYNWTQKNSLRLSIAWIYAGQKQWADAYTMISEYADNAHDNAIVMYNTGTLLMHLSLRYFKIAKKYFDAAIKIDSQFADTKIYKKYIEAANTLEYVADLDDEELLPKFIRSNFEPPLKFLRAVNGLNLKTLVTRFASDTINESEMEDINIEGLVAKNKSDSARILGLVARYAYLRWYKTGEVTDLADMKYKFDMSIKMYEDPYIYSYRGTYYKEVEGDYDNAYNDYSAAINIAESKKQIPVDPMFRHNIALLIIDEVKNDHSKATKLSVAYSHLKKAAQQATGRYQLFEFPKQHLSECKKMMKEYGINNSDG
jgi:hypothetical protein